MSTPFQGKNEGKAVPARRLAFLSALVVLGLGLSYVEVLIPVAAVIPLPGFKLGLANIVTLYMIFRCKPSETLSVVVVRSVLSALLFSGISGLAFSLTGGVFASVVMLIAVKGVPRVFSEYGVSMAGAVAHNTGQLFAASAVLKSFAVFSYYPVLVVSGAVMGIVIAFVSLQLLSRTDKVKDRFE
jgi:heptaprenyl diphosphate synthase